jgi:hypothetical protein
MIHILWKTVRQQKSQTKDWRSPEIDSYESIPPAYVSWRVGTSDWVVVPARRAGNRFLRSFKGFQIWVLAKYAGGIDSSESSPRFLKLLQIRALPSVMDGIAKFWYIYGGIQYRKSNSKVTKELNFLQPINQILPNDGLRRNQFAAKNTGKLDLPLVGLIHPPVGICGIILNSSQSSVHLCWNV